MLDNNLQLAKIVYTNDKIHNNNRVKAENIYVYIFIYI